MCYGNRGDESAGYAVGTIRRVTAMLQFGGMGSKTSPGEAHLQISVSLFLRILAIKPSASQAVLNAFALAAAGRVIDCEAHLRSEIECCMQFV